MDARSRTSQSGPIEDGNLAKLYLVASGDLA